MKQSISKIPITRTVFDNIEKEAVCRVLDSGWVVQGPNVAEFENIFTQYIKSCHVIATSSCTTALHLSLTAAGIGPGDEVLLPSFTFVASANAVEYTGARPVFIDIDLDTFTINANKIKEYICNHKNNTKIKSVCILPVSLFGLCADMEAINSIENEYELLVIEDAACGLGAKRAGHYAGTESLAGCFSFHPRKVITTGEGGMVVTDDDGLAEKIRMMRDHGASKTNLERDSEKGGSLLPEYNMLGYNYRMTDIQGALGRAQMNKIEMILREKQIAANRYNDFLKDLSEIKIPFIPEGYTHAYQSYVCLYIPDGDRFDNEKDIDWTKINKWNKIRNHIMKKLESNGISIRQGTHAVHTLGYYKQKYNLDDKDCSMSFIADRLSMSLPLYCGITEQEQKRVVEIIKQNI